ncbi:MAG: hypothetical protein DRH04_01990, partial [Deltaproteobacteria bacterium]
MITGKHDIDASLDANRPFLAYMQANALLHDADKITGEFIQWSLQGGKTDVGNYPGHNVFFDGRKEFLDHKETLLPFSGDLDIPFPCRNVALEPKSLCRELCADLLKECINNGSFIQRLHDSGDEDLVKLAGMLTRESGQLAKDFFSKDFTAILGDGGFADIQDVFAQRRAAWLQEAAPGKSLFDFYLWHHCPNIDLKTKPKVPTALMLFTAGTAGVDGIDTGYETASEKITVGAWHHEPQTLKDNKFLIATPFGFERESAISSPEKDCTVRDEIESLASVLKNGGDVSGSIEALERKVEVDFSRSIIRTGRPLNDVTLADHSISTASLALAHAARVVLESDSGAANNHFYCLPVRAVKNPENPDWPVTRFALFSCAVNAGHLDSMAMDLKDITAIRQEVDRLFTHFLELFTRRHPVGGFVYRDQHGIHLVVPVLGNPQKRFVQVGDDILLPVSAGNGDHNWVVDDADLLTNECFVQWLIDTSRNAILDFPLWFDQELLVGLRHAVIGDRLNQLAAAIKWTRTIDHLGVGPATLDESNCKVRTFQYHRPNWREAARLTDLCTVCGLRLAEKAGKCRLCKMRSDKSSHPSVELADIEKMAGQAEDNRLALLSVAFKLDNWLSEEDNSGIFLYAKNDPKAKRQKFKKDKKQQRLNSFGRLRRLWRVSERFLLEMRDKIRQDCRINADVGPSFMRTILLQPQDLQVILPADRCGAVLDELVEKFQQEFGRVAGRVPFHVSVLVFPFRTPIYLILEGSLRLRQAALNAAFSPVQVVRREDKCQIIKHAEDVKGRRFTFSMSVHWLQEFQPDNSL